MKAQPARIESPLLFDPAEIPLTPDYLREPSVKPIQDPVWTQNKALFIIKYLRYFVFITHHGTILTALRGHRKSMSRIAGQRS
jgi:hypothetical protein